MEQETGLLVVITGPTGVGKSSVCQTLQNDNERLEKALSVTTRPPREGEQDGVDYTFKSPQAFESMIDQGEFIEYSLQNNTDYYGLTWTDIDQRSAEGKDVLLELDVVGARRIRRTFANAVFIFVLPPTIEDMEQRLRSGKKLDDSATKRQVRLACEHIYDAVNFRYTVVNDDLQRCAREIENIIAAEHCRSSRREGFLRQLQNQCEIETETQ